MSGSLIFCNLSTGVMNQVIVFIGEDGSTEYFPGTLRGIIGEIEAVANKKNTKNVKIEGIYDMVQPIRGALEEKGFNICE